MSEQIKSNKTYDFKTLMKMPWDYEDQFTDNWFEGMLLCDIASDMKSMGLDGMAYTFQTLAKFKLEKTKVIGRLVK